MMILTLKMRPPLDSAQGTLSALEALRPAFEGSSGCLEFTLTVDRHPQGAIYILERWEAETDLARHIRSDGFRKILELMEISQEAPDLHVFQVEKLSGLEAVEAARSNFSV